MKNFTKIRLMLTAVLFCAALLGFFTLNLFHTPPEVSKAERRALAVFPKLNADFPAKFEAYALDSFICRDAFRAIKAQVRVNALRMLDNNGLFVVNGSVAKLSYLDEAAALRTAQKLNKLIAQLPQSARVFFAAIPDKAYYLAQNTAYPVYDFTGLTALFKESMPEAEHISLENALDTNAYFNTDLHWKQTELQGVLDALGETMGFSVSLDAFENNALAPFYGAYAGQSALNLLPDSLPLLLSEANKNARVMLLDAKTLAMKESVLYNESLFESIDPYNAYLLGPQPVVTLENPNAAANKELYIFRDSFSSSLAPLLTGAYKKITLIDMRYIASPVLFETVEFAENADVLFLYGSMVLGDSALFLVQ